jgi:calcineurin-like phosphoesterase family protein
MRTRQKWVISDTHFHHTKVLTFTDSNGNRIRPEFDTVEEMDDYMIQMWNQTVHPEDYVYHLGDVFMGNEERGLRTLERLHGQKRLVVGNHDNIRLLSGKGPSGNWLFKKVEMWKVFSKQNIIMSHVPLHRDNLYRGDPGNMKFMVNVHGHIHQHDSPSDQYMNMSVEKIGYTPKNLDEIFADVDKFFDRWGKNVGSVCV